MNLPIPAGMYASLRDWVTQAPSNGLPANARWRLVHTPKPFMLAAPGSVDRPVHPVFANRALAVPQAYAAFMQGGRFWGGKNGVGAVIAPDNKLVWDVSENVYIPGRNHAVFAEKQLPPAVDVPETVAVLTFVWSRNYFHWMIDVLARLDLLRRSGLHIDKYIVTGPEVYPFQTETLGLLGVPARQLLRTYDGFHIRAKTLVVPSLEVYRLLPFTANPTPFWAYEFLRAEMMKKIDASGPKAGTRLYISRASARHRKVVNESEVTRLLAARGFRSVTLEGMPIAEQVRLFASAEIVIAPHGAGLTNVIYCRPGTKVVDIYPTNYMYPCFWHLSNYAGLDYHYLIGQGKRLTAAEGIGHVGYVHDDIAVDIPALTAMLRLLGV